MNQVSKWAIAVLLAAGLSIGIPIGMASAQGTPGSASGGEAIAQSPAPAPAPSTGGLMGEHSMTGKVTAISETGKISIQTGIGELHLHFPPDSLAGVKEGDTLTVHLSFEKS